MTKELLKNRRNELGLTLRQVAEFVGVSEGTVSRWESGDIANMKRNHIAALAHILRIKPSLLVGVEDDTKTVKIPVLGSVPAGIPVEAVQDVISYEEIPENWQRKGEYFALKISGESMFPTICDGDIAIVRKTSDVKNGDTVIAMVNGYEATCKRYKKMGDSIMLLPNNQEYDPMYYSKSEIKNLPVKILGKVVELRRKME